ncbi:hypothetical protein QUB80_30615 [Chlorogloeopsis sp. ULAP01]|uniref:hypothetical protein n=1 Tax=Chlorogloeopsis sp. ULAP01 TaxID=3056483 RepID=UPI0025AA546C|nr:hypothetical protein [Chlorogloeopsis sp. ULAP01]MDM9385014.1 hypothetical protein [Chlorogloeopsis sp. ULAP01]
MADQLKKPQPPQTAKANSITPPTKPVNVDSGFSPTQVLPEQMSLVAHEHIQTYLKNQRKSNIDKNDLTAVLRLLQHLRVFGLLSAVGYVNQSNAQGGEVRERTVPVWESLLGQMINQANPPQREQLMEEIVKMTRQQPQQYMATWRRSLMLANHWNFWARAYQED